MADYDFTYTGAEIQAILDTGKKLKDSGYIFLGVATPSTNPGTPTQKVYYEAKQAGTYTNFGGVVLPDGMSLLIWNGSWTSETVMSGDGGVFDISVYKSTGGTLATFADLSAALDGGNNIPASARKGGMSVKFVQSSDNKYVQFRYMGTAVTGTPNPFLDTANWQGVDDVPTAGSDNLVRSGSVVLSDIYKNFNITTNLVDEERLTSGSYLKVSNGEVGIADQEEWKVTDYIPTFGKKICVSSNQNTYYGQSVAIICSYDKHLNFIRSINNQAYIVPTTDEYYVRFTIFTLQASLMANYGDSLLSYRPFVHDIQKELEEISDEDRNYSDFTFSLGINTKRNLLDWSKVEQGVCITTAGIKYNVSDTQWFVSDYIPVFYNNIISNVRVSSGNIATYTIYDYKKNFRRTVKNDKYEYENGDAFVRICSTCGNDNGVKFPMVNYGNTLSEFVPFGYKEKIDDLISINDVFNGELSQYGYGKDVDIIPRYGGVVFELNSLGIFKFKITKETGNAWLTNKDALIITGANKLHIKIKVDELIKTGSITGIQLYIANGIDYTSANNHVKPCGYISNAGVYEFVIDITSLIVHEGFTNNIFLWFANNKAGGSIEAVISEIDLFEVEQNQENVNLGDSLNEVLNALSSREAESKDRGFIVSPNGTRYVLNVGNDGTIKSIPVIPDSIALFGNSLINGFGNYGMAAPNPQSDYFYFITEYIRGIKQNLVTYRGESYSIENNESTDTQTIQNIIETYFVNHLSGNENLVVVQIGDNVNTEQKRIAFAVSFPMLLLSLKIKCPNARIIVMGMWYPNATNYTTMINSCENYGCRYIDISGLRNSSRQNSIGNITDHEISANRSLENVTNVVENTSTNITVTFEVSGSSYTSTLDVDSYSISGTTLNYNSRYQIISSAGAASHPNIKGFKAISNLFLYETGISDSKETYIE